VQKILKEPVNLFRLFHNDRMTRVFDQVDTHQACTCPVLHRFECTGRLVHAPFAGAGYVACRNIDYFLRTVARIFAHSLPTPTHLSCV
jgi:hypothetical protein